jgi:ribosomal protein S18 acetylase RimI-like enzyme
VSAIRPARPADAAAVARVHTRARTARGFTDRVPRDTDETVWAGRLAGEEAETVVAEAGGEVVGFASSTDTGDETLPAEPLLLALYVDPAHQGRGHGAALLTSVTGAWRARRARALTLFVHADNARARAFSERHGWVAEADRPDSDDELRYRRVL